MNIEDLARRGREWANSMLTEAIHERDVAGNDVKQLESISVQYALCDELTEMSRDERIASITHLAKLAAYGWGLFGNIFSVDVRNAIRDAAIAEELGGDGE